MIAVAQTALLSLPVSFPVRLPVRLFVRIVLSSERNESVSARIYIRSSVAVRIDHRRSHYQSGRDLSAGSATLCFPFKAPIGTRHGAIG